jgi:aryl-alcohol dehydrogenase-like predicted oxidoreductase
MSRFSRRDFLRASTVLAAGAAAPAGAASQKDHTAPRPTIRRYKPFGRTGWKVGDISVGSGQREPAVMDYIFGCGVNLIDSGQQYGGHEEMLGKVLPKWRSKVFVIDKWDPSFVTATVTKSALLESLDQSSRH